MSNAPRPATRGSLWNHRLAWTAVVLWAVAIFAVSARPGSTLPGGYSVQGHLGEYFVLGALLFWALSGRRAPWDAVVLAVILGSLYGITDEIHQHFVVMRTPDVTDWGLDTIGALAGALTAYAFVRLRHRIRTTP